MGKQAMNPFLPLWEYIPDGEPHVFGERLYLFGSHDSEGGERYCAAGNYTAWSAPTDDLSDWRCEGVIFNAAQDPRAHDGFGDLYAPDVVRGNDGRYYLYYCISGGLGDGADTHNTPIGVAVCDTPAGKYEYHGFVRNPDGSPYLRYLPHDPAVINDDGVIRLYHGYALSTVAAAAHGGSTGAIPDFKSMPQEQRRAFLLRVEQMLFHRSEEQLLAEPEDVMGGNHVILADDMLTVTSEPRRIVPGQLMAYGTAFEGHGFYEASSIRKLGDTYYFIYSDENSHALCYATCKRPDGDFVYRGVLISNGDVGLNGRAPADRLNMTANNHGSIECVNGSWYVFYHRHTHNSTYSRQACAEKLVLSADGSFAQAECTSCGLGGALPARGEYPAAIACNITNGRMPHITNRLGEQDIPHIAHSGTGEAAERFITGIGDGSRIVFKYFELHGTARLTLTLRSSGAGSLAVKLGDAFGGEISVPQGKNWQEAALELSFDGSFALELVYHGAGQAQLLGLRWS